MFGMVDTSITPALGYMELVPDRMAATLLPIISNMEYTIISAAHTAKKWPSTLMNGQPIVWCSRWPTSLDTKV